MAYIYMIAAAALFSLGLYAYDAGQPMIWSAAAALLGTGAFWQGLRAYRGGSDVFFPYSSSAVKPSGYMLESYAKAVEDFNYIQSQLPSLQDPNIAAQFQRMQRMAKNMISYLEKHPEKLPLARRFIDYYQDRAAALLRQYRELEASEVNTPAVRDAVGRLKDGLRGFDRAYEEQFSLLLTDHIDIMAAELKVAQQMMDADGIAPPPAAPKDGAAENLPALAPFQALRKAMLGSLTPVAARRHAQQKKLMAAILAMTFGAFGAHYFYLGKTFKGILSLIFFWTMIPGLIGFIQGLRYLFMPLDDFYFQYLEP